jgi:DNA-binding transcriptional MocR family regulator
LFDFSLDQMMKYARMPIEVESPEEFGYGNIRYNLSESSIADRTLSDFNLHIPNLKLLYAEHRGSDPLRALIESDGAGLTSKDVLITTGAAGALFIHYRYGVAQCARSPSSRAPELRN